MAKALALQGVSIDFVLPYTAEHPGVDFMNVHNATSLTPEQRVHMGSYDSEYITSRLVETDEVDDLTTMRAVQKHYADFCTGVREV
jgi:hypothetical protein